MTQDERTFGMLCHLAALASLVVPCGHVPWSVSCLVS